MSFTPQCPALFTDVSPKDLNTDLVPLVSVLTGTLASEQTLGLKLHASTINPLSETLRSFTLTFLSQDQGELGTISICTHITEHGRMLNG